MESLLRDLAFAVRTLKKNWTVTSLVVGSLALAIAGNAIVFAMINGFLYRPLPFEEPNRILMIGERPEEQPAGFVSPTSVDNFLDLRERQTSFREMAAFRGRAIAVDAGGDHPERVAGGSVTPEFFSLLGVSAARGRVFLPDEGSPGADGVVLLSWQRWHEEHGGEDVLGETLRLDGEIHQVVGVLPEEFEFFNRTDLWVPLVLERGRSSRGDRDLLALARLADGLPESAAEEEIQGIADSLRSQHPENRGYAVDVLNLREEIPDPRNRLFFQMLQGAMLFVVLIACANIANLLLARGQRREREIAVRASLGAGRGIIARQLLTESLVMAGLAGALGIGMGLLGVRQMVAALGDLWPRVYAPVIDVRVLAFTFGVAVFGGLLFGLAPVLQTLRVDLVSTLKDGTQASSSGRRKHLASSLLVIGELALALVFLSGAALLLRSFDSLQNQDPGFETANLLTMQLTLPEARYAEDEAQVAVVRTLVERLQGMAGVEQVIASNALPRGLILPADGITRDSVPLAPDAAPPQVSWLTTNPGYFDTLGIGLLAGRLLDDSDRLDSRPVVVLNQQAVSELFGEDDPLGERLTILGESREVVGVVQDVRHALAVGREMNPVAYLPWEQVPSRALAFSLATRVDPETLTESVRREIRAVDSGLAVSDIQTLDAVVDQFWAGQRVIGAILRGFGLVALALAAIGTYGVLAYSVVLRTQEIGIRMALGASRKSVVGMMMKRGVILGSIGMLFGLPGVLLVKAGLEQVFAGFIPVEMDATVGAVFVMVLVIALASFVPARRAASVDPLKALRWE